MDRIPPASGFEGIKNTAYLRQDQQHLKMFVLMDGSGEVIRRQHGNAIAPLCCEARGLIRNGTHRYLRVEEVTNPQTGIAPFGFVALFFSDDGREAA